MIVYPRYLPLFPADRHHLEPIILVYKITSVEFRAPMEIVCDRIHLDRRIGEELVDIVAGKFVVANGLEAGYYLIDVRHIEKGIVPEKDSSRVTRDDVDFGVREPRTCHRLADRLSPGNMDLRANMLARSWPAAQECPGQGPKGENNRSTTVVRY